MNLFVSRQLTAKNWAGVAAKYEANGFAQKV